MQGTPRASANARPKDKPILTPVKEPGPTVTATREILAPCPAAASTSAVMLGRRSA